MKAIRSVLGPLATGSLLTFFTLASVCGSLAQIINPPIDPVVPVVTIRATDPNATWAGDVGAVTVFRDGPTNAALNLYYRIGGSATNGVDYGQIGNWIGIAAGERTNTLIIKPIDAGQSVSKTVELVLTYPPTMPPINYQIGLASNALVTIRSAAATNLPPVVSILSPTNGSAFPLGANIQICADGRDDGYVSTVEFFAGTKSLGIRTNNPASAGPMNPFCLVWSNAPAGAYELTVKATDNAGASSVSLPVRVQVSLPGTTNQPPLVRISSPPNNALFRAPVSIPLFAYARDADDAVTTVEFFAGTNSLGVGQPITASDAMPGATAYPSNSCLLVWSNAPLGTYTLTAKATDNRGAWSLSEPVHISVLSAPPPTTNRPALVSIVATDPMAIEGTNCWIWRGVTNPQPTWDSWSTATFRFYTNCGPKNATFSVNRLGDTNSALTVAYAIGGTATNGVDYLPLSGEVTFRVGERSALVTVVPIDDGSPEINRTVILKLRPSSHVPAEYLVGSPRGAAAIILDSNQPRPVSGLLPDKTFHVNAAGPDGAWFRVEYSANMLDWTAICTNQVINGSIDFIDPEAQSDQCRFYRAMPESSPTQ